LQLYLQWWTERHTVRIVLKVIMTYMYTGLLH